MAQNKRQHTVQRAYLEQWNIGGNFFVYDLKNEKIYQSEPQSIFREKYIYNWDHLGEEGKFIIDDLITKIENDTIPIIKGIAERPVGLREKYMISKYISLQMLRTPKMKESFHEISIALAKNMLIDELKDPKKREKLFNDIPERNRKFLEHLSSDPEKIVEELFTKKLIIKITNIREIWLQNSLGLLESFTKKNFESPWYLLEAGSRTSFVTSDNPVVTISSVDNSINPTKDNINFTEVTFPLSPKILLLIKRRTGSVDNHVYRKYITESSKSVRELNCRTAMHSDRFIVSHSDKLLSKIVELTHDEWHEIRSDKKAYDLQSRGIIPTRSGPAKFRLLNRFPEK